MFDVGKQFDATHKTVEIPLYKVINTLHDENLSLTLCALNIGEISEGKDTVSSCGLGVFKKDRLVTFLDKEHTEAFLFAMGKINEQTRYTLKDELTLRVMRCDTKLEVSHYNESLLFKVNISMQADAEEMHKVKDAEALAKRAQEQLEESMTELFQSMQEEGLDIFGFSSVTSRKYPEFYSQIKNDWEKYFSEAVFSVNCDIKVKRTGQLSS